MFSETRELLNVLANPDMNHNSLTLWATKHKVTVQAAGGMMDRIRQASRQVLLHENYVRAHDTGQKEKTMAKTTQKEAPAEKETKKPSSKTLGTKEVAAMLKVEPSTLRRYLRSHDSGSDGQRYEWEKGSKALDKLLKDFKSYQEELAAAAEEDSKSNGKKSNKKASGKKASKKSKAEDEEDEDTTPTDDDEEL